MGLEIGKEVKVSFYGNDMNLYKKKGPKDDTSKLQNLVTYLNKLAEEKLTRKHYYLSCMSMKITANIIQGNSHIHHTFKNFNAHTFTF